MHLSQKGWSAEASRRFWALGCTCTLPECAEDLVPRNRAASADFLCITSSACVVLSVLRFQPNQEETPLPGERPPGPSCARLSWNIPVATGTLLSARDILRTLERSTRPPAVSALPVAPHLTASWRSMVLWALRRTTECQPADGCVLAAAAGGATPTRRVHWSQPLSPAYLTPRKIFSLLSSSRIVRCACLPISQHLHHRVGHVEEIGDRAPGGLRRACARLRACRQEIAAAHGCCWRGAP